MARIRTIKPDFFNSFDIASLTPLARLFYAYLWTEADREGLLEWKPNNFRMRFFPTDQYEVSDIAGELEEQKLIVIHEGDVCEIPGFTKHQVINNRESDSYLMARVKDACKRVKAEGRKEGREGKGVDASKQRFSAPTTGEVREYCQQRGNNIDPHRFVDFYESKGWMVGSNRMKDWKAAIRTWEKKEQSGQTTAPEVDGI